MIQFASGGKETFKGKKVAVSGSGNVAQYAALKAIELGATIVSLSDSKGTIIATKETGITPEEVHYIADLKVKRKQLTELTEDAKYKDSFKYIEGVRPWEHSGKIDVALPCATQNEVSGKEAEALISNGAKFIAEGSNMGCSQDAIDVFEKHRKEKRGESIWYAPGKCHDILNLCSCASIENVLTGTSLHRQGSKCWRRGSVRPRDGPKLPAYIVDL